MNSGRKNTSSARCWPGIPTADRVDLWLCAGVTDPACDGLTSRLAPDEQQRAAAYRFDVDRRRFVGSRFLLRTALAHYLARSANDLRFAAGAWGKPELLDDSSRPVPSFSLSRSHEVALLAVGGGPAIGVDVEFRRPERADSGIVERHFSEAEQRYIAQADHRAAAFFEIWARKEAYIKALGRGLSHPLREFDTTPDRDDQWTAVRDQKSSGVGSDWMLRNVSLPVENYAAALAMRPPATRLELTSVSIAELA